MCNYCFKKKTCAIIDKIKYKILTLRPSRKKKYKKMRKLIAL